LIDIAIANEYPQMFSNRAAAAFVVDLDTQALFVSQSPFFMTHRVTG
jgi:hypothetical protein